MHYYALAGVFNFVTTQNRKASNVYVTVSPTSITLVLVLLSHLCRFIPNSNLLLIHFPGYSAFNSFVSNQNICLFRSLVGK